MDQLTGNTFHLGINMPGAVSAGAYTAGVLDFLLEALEAWEAAKKVSADDRGLPIPAHKVCIEVLSGTSAGGVVAALAALDLLYGRTHTEVDATGHKETTTRSRVRRAWVDLLDIAPMLGTSDLNGIASFMELPSLLNSTETFGSIANTLAIPQEILPETPAYVAPTLSLFLTLSNLRGTPYTIAERNQGSPEQRIRYYADQIQFQFQGHGQGTIPLDDAAIHVPLIGVDDEDAWDVYRTASKATGAFPAAFAPQVLKRRLPWYTQHRWTVPSGNPTPLTTTGDTPVVNQRITKQTIEPELPASLRDTIHTLNVDGGVTDNNPFECARGYMAQKLLGTDLLHFPQAAQEVRQAIVTIAPFPGDDPIDPHYNPDQNKGLLQVLGGVLSALVAQSRFSGESLSLLKEGKSFSRFVIAPDAGPPTPTLDRKGRVPALQGGALGAFAGFLAQGYREHDYELGRYNCQRFLSVHFVLPESNVLVQETLSCDPRGSEMLDVWKVADQDRPSAEGIPAGERWIPIIPLCTAALRQKRDAKPPVRYVIPRAALDSIARLFGGRLRAILGLALRGLPFAVRGIAVTLLTNHLRDRGMQTVEQQLRNDLN